MTEASHLRTLRVLDLIFYQRMKKENLMPREELARLFPNLPELIEIHSEEMSSPPPPSTPLRLAFRLLFHFTRMLGPPCVENPGSALVQPEASVPVTPVTAYWFPDPSPQPCCQVLCRSTQALLFLLPLPRFLV